MPAETFRAHADDPRKLAEVLGASGVDASHEAVVVSGAGVTKEAALAYVMLEKLGQKKVSIFMDSLESVESLDKMARGGFGVTKEATIVGAPKKPSDAAVPPTSYPVVLRNDVTVASANGGGRAYPKVFLASGAAVPAQAPGGKVVHVPYTELLNGRRHAQGSEGHLGDPHQGGRARATRSSSPSPTIRARRRRTTSC